MAGFRGSYSSGPQYAGYSALIFWELANWGKNNESPKGLLISLEKIYSHIRAKLPEQFAINPARWGEMQGENVTLTDRESQYLTLRGILQKLEGDQGEIAKARAMLHCLQSEDVNKCTQDDECFTGILFGIYESLDEIVAVAKMIDNERMPANAPPAETV
jgi:hypothetical protein